MKISGVTTGLSVSFSSSHICPLFTWYSDTGLQKNNAVELLGAVCVPPHSVVPLHNRSAGGISPPRWLQQPARRGPTAEGGLAFWREQGSLLPAPCSAPSSSPGLRGLPWVSGTFFGLAAWVHTSSPHLTAGTSLRPVAVSTGGRSFALQQDI